MKVDIYQASKRPRPQETLYVFVGAEEDPKDKLPLEERERLGELEFMKTVDLERGQKRIGLALDEALLKLNEDGYYIQSTEFIIRFGGKSGDKSSPARVTE
jgi:hypothetical protein